MSLFRGRLHVRSPGRAHAPPLPGAGHNLVTVRTQLVPELGAGDTGLWRQLAQDVAFYRLASLVEAAVLAARTDARRLGSGRGHVALRIERGAGARLAALARGLVDLRAASVSSPVGGGRVARSVLGLGASEATSVGDPRNDCAHCCYV